MRHDLLKYLPVPGILNFLFSCCFAIGITVLNSNCISTRPQYQYRTVLHSFPFVPCTLFILFSIYIMTDIEGNTLSYSRIQTNDNNANNVPINPYSDAPQRTKTIADRILMYAKRLFYITISVYVLHHFKLYQAIFYSPNISHEWFKVGLATTIGTWQMVKLSM
jgi:hypothetical protein